MALAQLTIDLVAKVASFESDLKRVADSAEKQSNRMAQAFGLVKTGLATLAAGFSVGAISTFVRDTNNAIDALNDVSDATGSSIENISALENVARRTGGSLDDVGSILVKFNQVLGDINPDSPAAQALKAIGLNAAELRRIDPAEALRQTADALNGFADDGNKARIVQELFGKSVREAAPFLKDLAEQGRLNATVTREQAEEADKFNKELFKLQTRAEDLARSLASKVVPVLNQLFDDVGTFSEKASLASLAGDVLKFQKQLEALEKRRASPFNFSANLDQEIEQTRNRLAEAKRLFNGADVGRPKSPGGGRGFVNPEVVKPAIEAPPQDDPDAERRLREQERLAAEALRQRQREADEQRREELRVGELRNQLAGQRFREEQERLKGLDDLVNQITESEQRRIDVLLDNTPTAKLEQQRQTMLLLADALERGAITQDQFLEAASAELDLVAEKTEKAKTFAEEFGLSFSSALEDAIVKGGDLREVIDGLGQDILRIIVRKQVTEPLGNALGGFDFGSLFSGLFSFDGGGYTGSGMRAGGLDGKGGFLAMMHPQETVIDHTRGGSVGGVTVNVINQGGGALQVTGQTQRQSSDGGLSLEVIVQAVESGIADNLSNRSGPVARAMESGYGLRPSLN